MREVGSLPLRLGAVGVSHASEVVGAPLGCVRGRGDAAAGPTREACAARGAFVAAALRRGAARTARIEIGGWAADRIGRATPTSALLSRTTDLRWFQAEAARVAWGGRAALWPTRRTRAPSLLRGTAGATDLSTGADGVLHGGRATHAIGAGTTAAIATIDPTAHAGAILTGAAAAAASAGAATTIATAGAVRAVRDTAVARLAPAATAFPIAALGFSLVVRDCKCQACDQPGQHAAARRRSHELPNGGIETIGIHARLPSSCTSPVPTVRHCAVQGMRRTTFFGMGSSARIP